VLASTAMRVCMTPSATDTEYGQAYIPCILTTHRKLKSVDAHLLSCGELVDIKILRRRLRSQRGRGGAGLKQLLTCLF
jgi:hypothetical protein